MALLTTLSAVPSAAGDGVERPQALFVEGCHPSSANRPVCAAGAPLDTASFVDPTASIREAAKVVLGERVYVGPFAVLNADEAPIVVGAESNLQDNVTIIGAVEGDDHEGDRQRRTEADVAQRVHGAPGQGCDHPSRG